MLSYILSINLDTHTYREYYIYSTNNDRDLGIFERRNNTLGYLQYKIREVSNSSLDTIKTIIIDGHTEYFLLME